MYANLQAKDAYGLTNTTVRSTRSAEYDIFATITAAMSKAARADTPDFNAVVQALYDNRRLWTRLATDVADPENGLATSLKAQIVYLYEFTVHHSNLVLQNSATLDPLIDINRSIMRGLSGTEGGTK